MCLVVMYEKLWYCWTCPGPKSVNKVHPAWSLLIPQLISIPWLVIPNFGYVTRYSHLSPKRHLPQATILWITVLFLSQNTVMFQSEKLSSSLLHSLRAYVIFGAWFGSETAERVMCHAMSHVTWLIWFAVEVREEREVSVCSVFSKYVNLVHDIFRSILSSLHLRMIFYFIAGHFGTELASNLRNGKKASESVLCQFRAFAKR